MHIRIQATTLIIASTAFLLCSARAEPAENELLVQYTLPSNPDLNAAAREVEAKARTQRLAAMTICAKNPDVQACRHEAEITFRGLLLSDPDITFGLYVKDQDGLPRWLMNLGPKIIVANGFDHIVAPLEADDPKPLGIHVDSITPCHVITDSDGSEISYDMTPVCTLLSQGPGAQNPSKAAVEFSAAPESSDVSNGDDPLAAAFSVTISAKNPKGETKQWTTLMTMLDSCHFLYKEDFDASWGDYYHFKASGNVADLDPISLDVVTLNADQNDNPIAYRVEADVVNKEYRLRVTGYQNENTIGANVVTNFLVYFMAHNKAAALNATKQLTRRIVQCSKGADQ